MGIFGLCDANNFYCSCERAFDPKLKNVPLVVLSNNDGCCIARSQEAKDLGIKMGDPWFQIAEWAEAAGVRKFSSNYALYGDMSRRLFDVLQRFSPSVEPYSIDEMFLDLGGIQGDLIQHCQNARAAIRCETKIPTCIGIAETKTKAKLANFLAKKRPEFNGVCDLRSSIECARLYPTIPAGEVWGIGGASSRKLAALGVLTVADLASLEIERARQSLTVTGARVVMELQGISCLALAQITPQRKGLAVTRTFGQVITAWTDMEQAIASYATRAGEKLRRHELLATAMTVFIRTNRFAAGDSYSNQTSFGIEPTQDSSALIEAALRGARTLWRPGYRYWKAGIILNDLVDAKTAPADLFATRDPEKSKRLMDALDTLNQRFGRGALRPAISGFERKWTAKAAFLPRRYTTQLGEILEASA